MATDVIMPALGMAQDTGKVVRWLKSEGDSVAKGEPVVEVETDKVTVEVEAPADGTLAALAASEGDDVPVGRRVALILAPGESEPEAPAAVSGSEPQTRTGPESPAPPQRDGARPGGSGRPLASPKARRLASEQGVDLATVPGSGPHGAVVAADLERAPAVAEPGGRERGPSSIEIGTVWRRMAERTAATWQEVPHFYLAREVDASRLDAWRESARRRAGYEGVSHTDLLVKIAAAALTRHPRVNAVWGNEEIVPGNGVNVGVAVAVEDGLVVPVVRDADRLSLRDVSQRRAELVESARTGRLRPDDVAGGTFTISNLGMYGVDSFHAIVNAPQAAILAVGRIADRVVPVEGVPTVRPSLTLTLSFDHRVVDGARGAEFLDTLASLVEEPAGLVD